MLLVGANDVTRVCQYHSFYMLEHHRTSLSIQCNNDLDQLYSNKYPNFPAMRGLNHPNKGMEFQNWCKLNSIAG